MSAGSDSRHAGRIGQWRVAAQRALTSLHSDKRHSAEQTDLAGGSQYKHKSHSGRKWLPSSFRRGSSHQSHQSDQSDQSKQQQRRASSPPPPPPPSSDVTNDVSRTVAAPPVRSMTAPDRVFVSCRVSGLSVCGEEDCGESSSSTTTNNLSNNTANPDLNSDQKSSASAKDPSSHRTQSNHQSSSANPQDCSRCSQDSRRTSQVDQSPAVMATCDVTNSSAASDNDDVIDGSSAVPNDQLATAGAGASVVPACSPPSSSPSSCSNSAPEAETTQSDESPSEKALRKRRYVVEEMVETEREYISSLGQVVNGYMGMMKDEQSAVPLPEDLTSGKDKIIFGNIESIYEWHRDFFLKALERCVQRPVDLGALFKRYERKLHMYVVYCQNKTKSEHIVSEFIDGFFEELRKQLNHKRQLTDLLIQPVQRIMRYQLLLAEIHKLTCQCESLADEAVNIARACHVIALVNKAADDMMNVGRLQGFDGKITAQGKLLIHGAMLCSENAGGHVGRAKEHVVFLFEQSVIFSEALPRRNAFTNPGYVYKSHMQVNKMTLDERCDDPGDSCSFVLRTTDPGRPQRAYTCTPANTEARALWVSQIRAMLQTQQQFLRAIQSPIAFQRQQLARESDFLEGPVENGDGKALTPFSAASHDRLPLCAPDTVTSPFPRRHFKTSSFSGHLVSLVSPPAGKTTPQGTDNHKTVRVRPPLPPSGDSGATNADEENYSLTFGRWMARIGRASMRAARSTHVTHSVRLKRHASDIDGSIVGRNWNQ